jgi:MFS family permease
MTALTILMAAIDSTVVAVALSTLMVDLDTNLVWAGWTITSYALTQTVMLPMAGKLAEQFGQMRVFVACVSLFTLGSLLCALAPNVYALIACRLLQAIGGGGLFPAATGLVAQKFPRTRSRMIGLISSIFPIGGILGPNLGGFVLEHFGWRRPMLTGMICVTIALLLLGQNLSGLQIGSWQVDPLLSIMALSGLGMGMLIPASNNAGLDLMPSRAAVIAGLRGLFNNTGA